MVVVTILLVASEYGPAFVVWFRSIAKAESENRRRPDNWPKRSQPTPAPPAILARGQCDPLAVNTPSAKQLAKTYGIPMIEAERLLRWH